MADYDEAHLSALLRLITDFGNRHHWDVNIIGPSLTSMAEVVCAPKPMRKQQISYSHSLQLPLRPNNLSNHEMLMPTNLLARHNHNQIPHIANFVLIVGHKLFGVSESFSIFRHDSIPVHCDVYGFLHFVRHDLADERASRRVAAWRVVHEVPAGDGGHFGEFGVGHAGERGFDGRHCTAVVVDSVGGEAH